MDFYDLHKRRVLPASSLPQGLDKRDALGHALGSLLALLHLCSGCGSIIGGTRSKHQTNSEETEHGR